MRQHRSESRKGFTLIELSIVLVVIALIIGSVLVGRSLIRSSQVMSVISDVKNFSNAISQFSQKYNALPGDMANATSYWGANNYSPTTNLTMCAYKTTATTSNTSTCDGNGNGYIDGYQASNDNEAIIAWRQLVDAGFIQGQYNGKDNGSHGSILIGTDVPASRIEGAGYTVAFSGVMWYPGGGVWMYPWATTTPSHIIMFGAGDTGGGAGATPFAPAITTAEALSIDQKIDDGIPGTGSVRPPRGGGNAAWAPNCATSSNQYTGTYNTALSGNQCSLYFILGF